MTLNEHPPVTVEQRQELIEDLIFDGADPEGDAFMRGFAYGRFTELDSEMARHWGVGRDFPADECPIVREPVNLLARLASTERLREAAGEGAALADDQGRMHRETEGLVELVEKLRWRRQDRSGRKDNSGTWPVDVRSDELEALLAALVPADPAKGETT